MKRFFFPRAIQLLVLSLSFWPSGAPPQSDSDVSDSLVLAPSATNIKRSIDSCQELDYSVIAAYPGSEVLTLIATALEQRGWKPARWINRRWMRNPGVFKVAGTWEHFDNVAGNKTYLRAEQWTNKTGDLVSYNFWYHGPNLTSLDVYARYCGFQQVEEHLCIPGPRKVHDEKAYSLAQKITKVEMQDKDFTVSVEVENNGTKPVLVGLNGKLSDGSPELWALGVEQKEKGEWGYVGVVCTEHPPVDWITLKPGERLESWAMAVDFPEPNHWWAMCQRKIAHLGGEVRASLRYYPGVCEIENPEKYDDAYVATSKPVELPLLRQ